MPMNNCNEKVCAGHASATEPANSGTHCRCAKRAGRVIVYFFLPFNVLLMNQIIMCMECSVKAILEQYTDRNILTVCKGRHGNREYEQEY